MTVALLMQAEPAYGLSAGIVARVDGVIITERDVEKKTALLDSNIPRGGTGDADLKEFALDLLLLEKLKHRYLFDERALPVASEEVAARQKMLRSIWKKGRKLTEKEYQKQLVQHARQGLTWQGYVNRVANFNNPITLKDMLGERTRLRIATNEPRYQIEEIFLPQVLADSATQRLAQRLYKALLAGASFARLAQFTASLSIATDVAQTGGDKAIYKNALPPAIIEALGNKKINSTKILKPISSPYGVHIYRIRPYREQRRVTRYSFAQTIFLQSLFENSQGAQGRALSNRLNFCENPQQAARELGAYDLTFADDIPDKDISLEILNVLTALQPKDSAGPFPYAEGLLVFFTLCAKKITLDRADAREEIVQRLQKKRTEQLSLNIIEAMRIRAEIERVTPTLYAQ